MVSEEDTWWQIPTTLCYVKMWSVFSDSPGYRRTDLYGVWERYMVTDTNHSLLCKDVICFSLILQVTGGQTSMVSEEDTWWQIPTTLCYVKMIYFLYLFPLILQVTGGQTSMVSEEDTWWQIPTTLCYVKMWYISSDSPGYRRTDLYGVWGRYMVTDTNHSLLCKDVICFL